jgi:hypothetical protein
MNPVGRAATVEEYRDFGERQTADSPCFRDWALGVAGDPEVLALLDTLPPPSASPTWSSRPPGGTAPPAVRTTGCAPFCCGAGTASARPR